MAIEETSTSVQKKGITVRLAPDIYAELDALAKRNERSLAYLVGLAVAEFLENSKSAQGELKFKK